MNARIPILSISGSDSTGLSGIGADTQTIAALGGYAVTAVTCISSSLPQSIDRKGCFPLPPDIVISQVSSIVNKLHPKAIKVGLVTESETIRLLRDEVIASPRLVVAPGIFDSDGNQMIEDNAISAILKWLVPEALLLMLRCKDAEKMLGLSIKTDNDMTEAAQRLHEMGAKWVLLRGGQHTKGRLTALLYGPLQREKDSPELSSSGGRGLFFTSYNTDGWQRHGVAAALSAAITVRLGMGDDVPTAIRNAHDFIHSQVVYAKENDEKNRRAIDIYNAFVNLVAAHYTKAHDVSYYADRLCITTRYLSQVTDKVVGKSPKQIIGDYITSEARSYLDTTRLSIQEIADRLGFSSQVLFCKFFKTQQGISPRDYRKQ